MSVFVIGAGGHAKVVIATLQAAGETVGGVFDDSPDAHGTTVLGVPVLGPITEVRRANGTVIIAIGSNEVRARIAAGLDGSVLWAVAVHPTAWVHPSAYVGEGAVICAGAIVQPDAAVGRHTIVNTAASVDHDSRVGDFCHVAPGARLAGSVRLDDGAFMGIGSCAAPGTTVGAWTTVGAGAVVVRDLPERVVAVGVPARPMQTVHEEAPRPVPAERPRTNWHGLREPVR